MPAGLPSSEKTAPPLMVLPLILGQLVERPADVRLVADGFPVRIREKPRRVVIPQIDRPSKPVQRFGFIASYRIERGHTIRHLAIGRGCRQCFLVHEAESFLAAAVLPVC